MAIKQETRGIEDSSTHVFKFIFVIKNLAEHQGSKEQDGQKRRDNQVPEEDEVARYSFIVLGLDGEDIFSERVQFF
jgi:hypothetical protein